MALAERREEEEGSKENGSTAGKESHLHLLTMSLTATEEQEHTSTQAHKGKADLEIKLEDGPPDPAVRYPGKYGRNNKGGSLLTRDQFKEQAARRWVEYFGDSEKYANSRLSVKAKYLSHHLRALKVNVQEARALLVKVECDETREVANEQRENPVVEEDGGAVGDEEMEVDVGGGQDVLDNVPDEGEDGEGHQGEEKKMDCDSEEEDIDCEEDQDDGEVDEENRVALEFEVRKFMEMSDDELFRSDLVVPPSVEKSSKFRERKKNFIDTYMEEHDFQNSQEILEALSQAPPVVEDCLKKKLSHLSKQEKANRLLVKTLSDTIQRLKETPGAQARKQVQVILAAVTHHRLRNKAYYQLQ